MPKKLDPAVKAVLDKMLRTPTATFDNHMLEYAKGVADGSIKVRYFKASDIPEKKVTPEAFKKQHKMKAKRVVKRNVDELFAFMAINVDAGLTRQQSISAAIDKFKISKHSAGYHFDKAAGKR